MKNSPKTTRWMNLRYLVPSIFLLFGCSATPYPITGQVPESVSKILIPKAHVWQHLHAYGEEEAGYATYSYVLVGRDETNATSAALYQELVKAIKGSTPGAENTPEHVSTNNFNLFIIPVTRDSGGDDGPNYEVSKLLLLALATDYPGDFSRPGPYLITLYEPISFGLENETANILYVDLTTTHPLALPEVVRVYKERITDDYLDGLERLHSLRLALLNLALVAEENIGFAKTAYAELRGTFQRRSDLSK
jgi:hypothetical protein